MTDYTPKWGSPENMQRWLDRRALLDSVRLASGDPFIGYGVCAMALAACDNDVEKAGLLAWHMVRVHMALEEARERVRMERRKRKASHPEVL